LVDKGEASSMGRPKTGRHRGSRRCRHVPPSASRLTFASLLVRPDERVGNVMKIPSSLVDPPWCRVASNPRHRHPQVDSLSIPPLHYRAHPPVKVLNREKGAGAVDPSLDSMHKSASRSKPTFRSRSIRTVQQTAARNAQSTYFHMNHLRWVSYNRAVDRRPIH